MNEISFYPRFCDDILNARKTITIRNIQEANYNEGEVVKAFTFPDGECFCKLKINSINPITLPELTAEHAIQENMSLAELQTLIPEIYPNEQQFYVTEFELI